MTERGVAQEVNDCRVGAFGEGRNQLETRKCAHARAVHCIQHSRLAQESPGKWANAFHGFAAISQLGLKATKSSCRPRRALNFCLSRYTVVQQPPFREGKQEWRKRDFRRGSIPIRPQTPMPTIYVHFADGMREEERGDRVSRGPRGLSRCDLFFMRNREAHCKCQEDGAQLPERTRASGEREPNMPIQTKWPRDGQKEGRKEGQTDGDLFLGE